MDEGLAIVVGSIISIMGPGLYYFFKHLYERNKPKKCPLEIQDILQKLMKATHASRVYVAAFLHGNEDTRYLGLRVNGFARAICELTDGSVPEFSWKYQDVEVAMWGKLIEDYRNTGRNYFPDVDQCPYDIPKQLMIARGARGSCGAIIKRGKEIIGVLGADFPQPGMLNENRFSKIADAADDVVQYITLC